MNRRGFLKAVLAAAVVAQIPISLQEAEAAYDSLGIEDMGNGWYRCWMSFDESNGPEVLSTYAKAGTSSHMQLSFGRVRAWFDLETGTLGTVEVVEERRWPNIKMEDGRIWGAQIERGCDRSTNHLLWSEEYNQ